MRSRVIPLVAVSVFGCAIAAAAQRAGTVEAGVFAPYTAFDHSLALSDMIGVGGRLGVYLRPTLAVEVDISRTSADGPAGESVTHTPFHAWLVYGPPLGTRTQLLLAVGFVRNRYGDAHRASDNGLAGLVGVGYRLNDRLALRADATEDFVTAPANASPQVTYNANLGIRLGLSAWLHASPMDSRRRDGTTPPSPLGEQVSAGSRDQARAGGTGTGAVTTIIPTEADARVARVEDLLRNRVPGLQVIPQADGSYTLRLRGQGGLMGESGEHEPLLVIDGTPTLSGSLGAALAGLAPRDIARIDILRDAAATSIYGTRGASGVITITTKRAR